MIVLIDAFHPDRQSGEIGRNAQALAIGALEGEIAERADKDILENAGSRNTLDLPDIGHPVGLDRSGRIVDGDIVIVGHAERGHRQEVADLQRSTVIVDNGERAERIDVPPQARIEGPGRIGELQPLDVLQRIDAVATHHGVEHRHDIVAQVVDRSVVVDGPLIIRDRA